MTNGAGFVCAVNRDRDGYQVPLALHEAGLLDALVTDFYRPDSAHVPAFLARRHVDGLPSAKAVNSWPSFAGQLLLHATGLWNDRTSRATDRLLAATAGRVARRSGAHLHCYDGYLPAERAIPAGRRRIVFAYHPPPALGLDILAADAARFPEVAASFARERHARAPGDWTRADAVVCASTVTRRALEHEGCPPERIAVVPYGIDPVDAVPTPPRTGRAEFLFVGQGIQRKGLHHLLAAWRRAALRDARLTLVCHALDPGFDTLTSAPGVRLLGRQPRAALAALYAAADLFVMPSLVEGFGLVYGEALAHGCHVIGTPNTGLPDWRLPATAATLVPVGDPDALAAALTRGRDAALAGTLDRAAIRAAAATWSWADFRQAIAAHARGVLG